MTTYQEKLKDPRWQKKRLEILERDHWECQNCGENTITLCIHHRSYLEKKEPWEYPNEFLITLCEPCHLNNEECAPWNVYDKVYLRISTSFPDKKTINSFRKAKILGLFNGSILDWLSESHIFILKDTSASDDFLCHLLGCNKQNG